MNCIAIFTELEKKTIKASSFEEAKQILEEDEHVCFDEIIRLTKPCWVDENISRHLDDPNHPSHQTTEFKNWGSE